MDQPEREAQIKGYDDGHSHSHNPHSVRGTKFTGHLAIAYERGFGQGRAVKDREMQQLREL